MPEAKGDWPHQSAAWVREWRGTGSQNEPVQYSNTPGPPHFGGGLPPTGV